MSGFWSEFSKGFKRGYEAEMKRYKESERYQSRIEECKAAKKEFQTTLNEFKNRNNKDMYI